MVVNGRRKNQYMERGRHMRMLQNGVLHTLSINYMLKKMAFRRSDYFFENCDIVHCALENGAELYVNEDQ